MACVRLSIPWRALLTAGVRVELEDVELSATCQHGAQEPLQPHQQEAHAPLAPPSQPSAPRSRTAVAAASLRAAASAAWAHIISRLGVRVQGLRVRLSGEGGDEETAWPCALLRFGEVCFSDVSESLAGGSHGARKLLSFAGAQLRVGLEAQPMWRVLGPESSLHSEDAEEELENAGWSAAVTAHLPLPGACDARMGVQLGAMALRLTPGAVRGLAALVTACAPASAAEATAPPEADAQRTLLDSMLLDGGDAGEAAEDDDEFFECLEEAEALAASLHAASLHPADAAADQAHAMTTEAVEAVEVEEEDHWSADNWRSLHEAAAASTHPLHAAAAAAAAAAPPPTVALAWTVSCRMARLCVSCELDGPAAPRERHQFACDGLFLHAYTRDGTRLRSASLSVRAACLLRRGCSAAAQGERRAMAAALPPCPADAGSALGALPHHTDVALLTFRPDAVADAVDLRAGAPAADESFEDQGFGGPSAGAARPWRLAVVVQPAAAWLDEEVIEFWGAFSSGCRAAGAEAPAASAAPAATLAPPWTCILRASHLRLACSRRGGGCAAMDLRAPSQTAPDAACATPQPPPPLLRAAWSAGAGADATVSFAAAEVNSVTAGAGEALQAHRAARLSGVTLHLVAPPPPPPPPPPPSLLHEASGASLGSLPACAWAVACASAAHADEEGTGASTASDASLQALTATLRAGAALRVEVACEAAELCSHAHAPFLRLFEVLLPAHLPPAHPAPPAPRTSRPPAAALTLSLNCGRLSVRLLGAEVPEADASLRLTDLCLLHASRLDHTDGSSFVTLRAATLTILGADGAPLLRCSSELDAPDIDAASHPGLSLTLATRPCEAHDSGELLLAAVLRRVAAAAPVHDASLSRLRSALERSAAELSLPPPRGPDGAPMPPPRTSAHVAASGAALVHSQPCEPGSVAATLLARALCLRVDADRSVTLQVRDAELQVGPPRAPSLAAAPAPALAFPTAAALAAAGMVPVARETRLSARFYAEGGTSVAEVANHLLAVDTHADTHAALLSLISQLQCGEDSAEEDHDDVSDDRRVAASAAHPALPHTHVPAVRDALSRSLVPPAARRAAGARQPLQPPPPPPPPSTSPELIDDFFVRDLGGSGEREHEEVFDEEFEEAWCVLTIATRTTGPQRSSLRSSSAPPPLRRGYYPPGAPPAVLECYVPASTAAETAGNVEAPPGHYPESTSRWVLHPASLAWTLHCGSALGDARGAPAQPSAIQGVRLCLSALTLRRDCFPLSSPAAVTASRTVLAVASLRVEDVSTGAKWPRVVEADAASPQPRIPCSPAAHQPDLRLLLLRVVPGLQPGAGQELRMHAAAAPLRVRLDQVRPWLTLGALRARLALQSTRGLTPSFRAACGALRDCLLHRRAGEQRQRPHTCCIRRAPLLFGGAASGWPAPRRRPVLPGCGAGAADAALRLPAAQLRRGRAGCRCHGGGAEPGALGGGPPGAPRPAPGRHFGAGLSGRRRRGRLGARGCIHAGVPLCSGSARHQAPPRPPGGAGGGLPGGAQPAGHARRGARRNGGAFHRPRALCLHSLAHASSLPSDARQFARTLGEEARVVRRTVARSGRAALRAAAGVANAVADETRRS